MSTPRTKFAPCKTCHEMVEFELPEPEKVQVREKCQCGLTETARVIRYWVTGISLFIVAGSLSLYGSCHSANQAAIEATRSQVNEHKIRNEQMTATLQELKNDRNGYILEAQKVRNELKLEIQYLRTEIEKYRYVMGELKTSAPPEVADKFIQPEAKKEKP